MTHSEIRKHLEDIQALCREYLTLGCSDEETECILREVKTQADTMNARYHREKKRED
jgi:hypothetical protein